MGIWIKLFGILSMTFSLYIFANVVIPRLLHPLYSNMFTTAYFITAICWMIFGIGVLKRLAWARVGLIVVAAIYIVDSVEYPSRIVNVIRNQDMLTLTIMITGLIFFISVIIFFTRPRVKQQFINDSKKR